MSQTYIAYKFRIYPYKEQRLLFGKTFGCVRFIYNHMLKDKIEYYEKTKKKLNNTPAQYKKEYPWLKEVDSLALANAQMHLQTAYNNFFRDSKVGYPKFKSKKRRNESYTTNYVNGNIRLENQYLVLPKVKAVKIKLHRDIPKDYQLKSVTVSKTPSGKYYASILFEYEQKDITVMPQRYLGLDYSMKELYIASDGSRGCYPRYYRQSLEKLTREQRKLSKMKQGSQNRNKQRIKVAKLHEKVANQRKDFLHKQSRQIANVYDCVSVEDLDMKGMSQALKFGKSVTDNAYGMFVRMLEYKLKAEGKTLIKIDKWYPSSKTCSVCGNVKKELGLGERTYKCEKCGAEMDRDYNASVNIRNKGMQMMMA